MVMRGSFVLRMLHFDHGYVTCLYDPFYLVGDACTKYVAILFALCLISSMLWCSLSI
jgi:hypothetical protein